MPSPLVLVAAALLGAAGAPADSLMGPGVAQSLARARAATLADVRYDLRLDVTARDSAVGHVRISFTRSGGDDLVVDFRGRSLGAVRVNGRELPRGGYEFNGAHLRVPAASLRAGANEVELPFVAVIAPAGASVIRYHDTSDGAD
jgi:aminopeptidase N